MLLAHSCHAFAQRRSCCTNCVPSVSADSLTCLNASPRYCMCGCELRRHHTSFVQAQLQQLEAKLQQDTQQAASGHSAPAPVATAAAAGPAAASAAAAAAAQAELGSSHEQGAHDVDAAARCQDALAQLRNLASQCGLSECLKVRFRNLVASGWRAQDRRKSVQVMQPSTLMPYQPVSAICTVPNAWFCQQSEQNQVLASTAA